MLRAFFEKEAPTNVVWQNDREERFPEEILQKMADLGLHGMCIDPAYGGNRLDEISVCIVDRGDLAGERRDRVRLRPDRDVLRAWHRPLRHRGAEADVPARGRGGSNAHRDGAERARGRVGPDEPLDPRRQGRWQLRDPRAEGVHHGRRHGRVHLLLRAHEPGRALVARALGDSRAPRGRGRHRAPAAEARRPADAHVRGVSRRRPCAGRRTSSARRAMGSR